MTSPAANRTVCWLTDTPYANICEHCPSFRTDTASIVVLSAQRVDTEALAVDAERRGWIDEAD